MIASLSSLCFLLALSVAFCKKCMCQVLLHRHTAERTKSRESRKQSYWIKQWTPSETSHQQLRYFCLNSSLSSGHASNALGKSWLGCLQAGCWSSGAWFWIGIGWKMFSSEVWPWRSWAAEIWAYAVTKKNALENCDQKHTSGVVPGTSPSPKLFYIKIAHPFFRKTERFHRLAVLVTA